MPVCYNMRHIKLEPRGQDAFKLIADCKVPVHLSGASKANLSSKRRPSQEHGAPMNLELFYESLARRSRFASCPSSWHRHFLPFASAGK